MRLNLDRVPKNLNEAVSILTEAIESSRDRESLKDPVIHHFGFGMYLRNSWSLWDRETIIVQWFKKNLGLVHADDISGTILEALACSIKGEDFDPIAHAQTYIDHWKKIGVDLDKA